MTEQRIRAEVLADRAVRVLVCNAAYNGAGRMVDVSLARSLNVVDVNVRGTALLTHLVVDHLQAAGHSGGVVLMMVCLFLSLGCVDRERVNVCLTDRHIQER